MNRILFLIPLLVLTGCGKWPSSSGVIDRFGTYSSPDGLHTLVVSKQEAAIVAFTISDASGGRVLYSDRIGSDGERWCFYWDRQGQLWAYSSDTGYFAVFAIQADGTVTRSDVSKDTAMPKRVYEFLPSSLKHVWGI